MESEGLLPSSQQPADTPLSWATQIQLTVPNPIY